jgi:archaemetzincin
MNREGQADGVRGVDFLVIGAVNRRVLEGLVAGFSRRVNIPCRIRDEPLRDRLPHLSDRNQVDADVLLRRLETRAADREIPLVGVTMLDLGTPLFAHMFGQARLRGTATVVSLARLTPTFYGLPEDEDLTVSRAVLEVLHEFGHLAGLKHCRDFACIMHRADVVEAIDVRGDTFCVDCLPSLPRDLLAARG